MGRTQGLAAEIIPAPKTSGRVGSMAIGLYGSSGRRLYNPSGRRNSMALPGLNRLDFPKFLGLLLYAVGIIGGTEGVLKRSASISAVAVLLVLVAAYLLSQEKVGEKPPKP